MKPSIGYAALIGALALAAGCEHRVVIIPSAPNNTMICGGYNERGRFVTWPQRKNSQYPCYTADMPQGE